MTDLFAARAQMGMSLGFHILFAVVGIAMPLLMVIAEHRWLRTRDAMWLELAQRWAKGTAILFAVGAVSGTVLSFELGLLWPGFMGFAGPVVGMPFSLEGFAFFLEAIFLGVYLYGWEKVSAWAHWLAGVMVLLSGAFSGIFVVTANAWMNHPTGFVVVGDTVVHVAPFAAMWNPAAVPQALHMTLASFAAVGFGVAGVHASQLLGQPDNLFHRRALAIALPVGAIGALLVALSGDVLGKYTAEHQPVKLAAAEALWETEAPAAFLIGGWPDEASETTRGGLHVPYLLSVLATGDPHGEVRGLKAFPADERPPVAVVHTAFQIMIGCGVWMIGVGGLGGLLAWRRRGLPDARWYLRLLVVTLPVGVIAIEAGWTVTEVGRQPWIVRGWLRTADAVTPMPGISYTFLAFTLLYVVLALVVVHLMRRQVFASPRTTTDEAER